MRIFNYKLVKMAAMRLWGRNPYRTSFKDNALSEIGIARDTYNIWPKNPSPWFPKSADTPKPMAARGRLSKGTSVEGDL